MTILDIPVTLYSVRGAKPTTKYGAPSSVPLRNAGTTATRNHGFAAFNFDKLPAGAIVTKTEFMVYTNRAHTGTRALLVRGVTSAWTSSIYYSRMPTVGAVIQTLSAVAPPASFLYAFDITAWSLTRPRNGLRLETSATTDTWVYGSAAATMRPFVRVTYFIPPKNPAGQAPNGGWVSVAKPILAYVGDPDMTAQNIEFSNNGGSTILWASGFHQAFTGRFNPADFPTSPAVAANAEILWRVTTDGPTGQSAPSAWARYGYKPLPAAPTFSNPPAVSPDGSPPLVWASTGQAAYLAELYQGSTLLASSGQVPDPAERTWTPAKGVTLPGGVGRFDLTITDNVAGRIAAEGAPTAVKASLVFTATITGAGNPIDTLNIQYEEPVITFTGTRDEGIPDEVGLFRDGVQVPMWNAQGEGYQGWAPGTEFFTGTSFKMWDYTTPLHGNHTWNVRVRVNGVTSSAGPTIARKFVTKTIWLVKPGTLEKVEIVGHNGVPAIDMATVENSIVHTPINQGVRTEPVRRRLTRTTKSGSIEGSAHGGYEDTLEKWTDEDSGTKYRLIFGKVNWPVILGDYNPIELSAYPPGCGPDRVLVSMNWWQRLSDV